MDNAKRDFVFIDESGDPGKADITDSSDFYMVTALHVTDRSLREMTEHFCRMRYFHGFTKELKNIYKNSVLLRCITDIYDWLHEGDEVFCTSGYLMKQQYNGPYLSNDGYGGYNPQYFRNFIVRRVLERHFYLQNMLSSELEIVVDRFIEDDESKKALFDYLGNNYLLPHILHLVQVDSRYVEGVQLVDLIARVVKAKHIDGWTSIAGDDLDFVEVVCLDHVPKKFPEEVYVH